MEGIHGIEEILGYRLKPCLKEMSKEGKEKKGERKKKGRKVEGEERRKEKSSQGELKR